MKGRLGYGGVTKLGSGPSGIYPVFSLLSGDTCVVTEQLYGMCTVDYQGMACCGCGGKGPAAGGTGRGE